MKNTFQNLAGLMIAALACLVLAPVASNAQQYAPTSLTATNKQGTAVTNSVPETGNVIGVTKYEDVALLIGAELMATGTSTSVWRFAWSIDGSTNYQTQGALSPFNIVMTHTGTTPDYFITNITAGSIGYLKLLSIGNNGTQILTNITVKYVSKPRRNG